ncbi:MAG: acyltransferase family protein [Caulobacteraceae bacterium]
MRAEHLKSLTSLRFFAAMWVVLYAFWPNLTSDAAPGLVARGSLGVEVFFILSGFILCHVYLPAWEAGRFTYGKFLWARIARVYPLHLATLVGIGAIAGAALFAGMPVDKNILAWDALPANLTMTNAWGLAKTAGWNHPSWSISAEWLAYLSFPLFATVAAALSKRPRLALGGAVAFLFALYAGFERVAGFPLTEATIAWGALRIVPCFALGCAVYLLWRSGAVQGRTVALAGTAVSLAVMALGAAFNALDGVIVTAGAGLILFLAAAAKYTPKLGSNPVLVYLGEVSYAVDMVAIPWQLVFVNADANMLGVEKDSLPLWTWLILLAGVVPVAAIAHHLVERPARTWLRTWGPRSAAVGTQARPA